MVKETIGGFPYTIESNGETKTIRFFPKVGTHPNDSVLVLNLDKDQRMKLIHLLSE